MVLLFHIIVALASVLLSTYVLVRPSRIILRSIYGLIALTAVSGTYVAVTAHASLLSTCVSGLFYVAIVATGIAGARRKLANAPAFHA